MHEIVAALTQGIALTGDVRKDVPVFLARHGHPKTAAHSARVARKAERIARNCLSCSHGISLGCRSPKS